MYAKFQLHPFMVSEKKVFILYIFTKFNPFAAPATNQNNCMECSGSATIKNVAHPKHPEEEETSPNRNHIMTGKQQQTN